LVVLCINKESDGRVTSLSSSAAQAAGLLVRWRHSGQHSCSAAAISRCWRLAHYC